MNMHHSHEQTGAFRLGVSPLSWVNEVLEEFGSGTTPDTCLSEAAAAGYEGVELSRIFPREADQLSNLLSRYGLQFISGWHNGYLADRDDVDELEAVHEHASLLVACGAEVMVYGECGRMIENALDVPMSRRLRLKGSEISAYGDRLTRFADALRSKYGLALSYHHHLMMVSETFEEIEAIMSVSGPSVGLLLDTGHAGAGGFDYVQLIDEFGPRINHIHLKDVRGEILANVRACDLSFNDAVRAGIFTIPGDGMIDFGPVAKFLSDSGYSGWLVVEAEQNPLKAPPAETVKRAHHNVTEVILKPALEGV